MTSPLPAERAAAPRRTVAASLAVFCLIPPACGGDGDSDDDSAASARRSEAVTEFTVVAEALAWDKDRVVLPAGEQVTATVDNRDRGLFHNWHAKAPGDPKTELEQGPLTQTLTFTVDQPGSYEFVCDAHVNMTGTLVVV